MPGNRLVADAERSGVDGGVDNPDKTRAPCINDVAKPMPPASAVDREACSGKPRDTSPPGRRMNLAKPPYAG